MQWFQIIDRWTVPRRWTGVGAILALSLAFCAFFPQEGSALLSPLFILFIPLALCALYLGIGPAIFLAFCYAGVSFLNHLSGVLPLGVLLPFLLGVALNTVYWHRWIQGKDLKEFQFQKTLEEMELAMVDLKLAHERVRVARQANRDKILRYSALNDLARSLAMTFKTREVVGLLIETISKTFMVPDGVYTLLLFDSSVGKALHAVRYSVGTGMEVRLNRERLDPQEVFNAWVVAQAKTLFINDAANDFRFQNMAEGKNIKGLVVAPLVAGNELLGLFRMESSQPGAFRQEDARLLSNFCDLGTVALEFVALYRQTIELAITDGLTGLYVQRYYKERVRDEVFRALEHKLPLCLMMIDVDNFKSYNDRYGHLVGDRVLKAVSQVLRETVRTVDLVARYGGEEFSVLLPKTPWSGAQSVAERIRQKVAEQEIPASQQSTHITVSIGVTELDPSIKDVEAFIDSADQALYQAKADGKNRVRFAGKGHQRG
jgi:diguanylate cyclase (GGDEF)-like protein